MVLSDWLNVAQVVLLIAIIPCGAWILNKVTAYFKEVADLQTKVSMFVTDTNLKIALIEKDITGVQINCGRHQKWMEETQKAQARIDRNLIRVCAELQIDDREESA